mmetsp:Transcript_82020/g.163326  ORF Transcript_82020/g.163326 Transcript_82020/m.163326 type:complete len:202 (-) Transcript_82020:250-855(-)
MGAELFGSHLEGCIRKRRVSSALVHRGEVHVDRLRVVALQRTSHRRCEALLVAVRLLEVDEGRVDVEALFVLGELDGLEGALPNLPRTLDLGQVELEGHVPQPRVRRIGRTDEQSLEVLSVSRCTLRVCHLRLPGSHSCLGFSLRGHLSRTLPAPAWCALCCQLRLHAPACGVGQIEALGAVLAFCREVVPLEASRQPPSA